MGDSSGSFCSAGGGGGAGAGESVVGGGGDAASSAAAAEGSGRRTAAAAASEGTRRKSRRDAAEADTLRRGEEEEVVAPELRGLARRPERGDWRSGLKGPAFRDGAWDILAAELEFLPLLRGNQSSDLLTLFLAYFVWWINSLIISNRRI
jgi:hypothetical protein